MVEHITKYWVTYLCGLIAGMIGGFVTHIKATSKKKKALQDAKDAAILALLHDRLYQACGCCLRRGWMDEADKENLEGLFIPYEKMGGNGTCHVMYEQCLKLPPEPRGGKNGSSQRNN